MQKTIEFTALEMLGFAHVAEKANVTIRAENDRLKAANNALPEDQRKPEEEIGLKELWTTDSYLTQRCRDLGFGYLRDNAEEAAKAALEKVSGMSAPQQGRVFNALGLGAVATSDPAAAAELALSRFLTADRPVREELAALVYPEYGDAPEAQRQRRDDKNQRSRGKKGKK